MSPEQWIEKMIAASVEEDARKIEAAIIAHFGTAERAQRLAGLFPDRFTIERTPVVGVRGLFLDAAPTLTYTYSIRDALRPNPDPRSTT